MKYDGSFLFELSLIDGYLMGYDQGEKSVHFPLIPFWNFCQKKSRFGPAKNLLYQ
jgi:hypothetical protein